jgi:hypothetical protein
MEPAMVTLGRDGSDFAEDDCRNTNSVPKKGAVIVNVDVDPRPWWDRVTVTNPFKSTAESSNDSTRAGDVSTAAYTNLEAAGTGTASGTGQVGYDEQDSPPGNGYASLEEKQSEGTAPQSDPHASLLLNQNLKTVGLLEQSVLRSKSQKAEATIPGASASAVSMPMEYGYTRSSTAEDLLQQDCAFFYQGMESPPSNNDKPIRRLQRLRALVRPTEQLNQHSLFEYRDSVDVLAPPVLAHYRARYQQLNQDLLTSSNDLLHHDLELTTDGDGILLTNSTNNIMMVQTVENSSLFYRQHGRMLMRLPRDQVRLVMDNDLEAGILSVEQWQLEGDDQQNVSGSSRVPVRDRPPLRYVLTVQDDLYRRIVAEMSEGLTKPYWGLSGCCHENEKVDIRVAISVMVVIMIILLINTIIWPVE